MQNPCKAGLFITFEGVDGTGKSTQTAYLKEYLESLGAECVVTREPGGTAPGRQIREILLHSSDDISDRAEALLYAADRAQHVDRVIKPALESGKVVISDRYIDSSLAYQAAGRVMRTDGVKMINEFAVGGTMPNRTYLLDMDYAASKQRLEHEPDRLESAGAEFFERTRKEFLNLAEREPDRFVIIDASQSVESVRNRIREDIGALLCKTSAGIMPAGNLQTNLQAEMSAETSAEKSGKMSGKTSAQSEQK